MICLEPYNLFEPYEFLRVSEILGKVQPQVSCTKKTGNNQARFQQIVMRKLCCFRFAKEYVDEDTESESSDDTMAESEDDNDVESGDILIS